MFGRLEQRARTSHRQRRAADNDRTFPSRRVALGGDVIGIAVVGVDEAELPPRERALADYAAKMTRNATKMTASDLEPLRAAGYSDLEILDATHAIAMFAWANRLMQTLGEPVAKQA